MVNKFKSPEGIVKDMKLGNSFFDQKEFSDFLIAADIAHEQPNAFIERTAETLVPQKDPDLKQIGTPGLKVTLIEQQLVADQLERTTAETQKADQVLNKFAGSNLAAIELVDDEGKKITPITADAVADVPKSPSGTIASSGYARDAGKTQEKFLTVDEDGIV